MTRTGERARAASTRSHLLPCLWLAVSAALLDATRGAETTTEQPAATDRAGIGAVLAPPSEFRPLVVASPSRTISRPTSWTPRPSWTRSALYRDAQFSASSPLAEYLRPNAPRAPPPLDAARPFETEQALKVHGKYVQRVRLRASPPRNTLVAPEAERRIDAKMLNHFLNGDAGGGGTLRPPLSASVSDTLSISPEPTSTPEKIVRSSSHAPPPAAEPTASDDAHSTAAPTAPESAMKDLATSVILVSELPKTPNTSTAIRDSGSNVHLTYLPAPERPQGLDDDGVDDVDNDDLDLGGFASPPTAPGGPIYLLATADDDVVLPQEQGDGGGGRPDDRPPSRPKILGIIGIHDINGLRDDPDAGGDKVTSGIPREPADRRPPKNPVETANTETQSVPGITEIRYRPEHPGAGLQGPETGENTLKPQTIDDRDRLRPAGTEKPDESKVHVEIQDRPQRGRPVFIPTPLPPPPPPPDEASAASGDSDSDSTSSLDASEDANVHATYPEPTATSFVTPSAGKPAAPEQYPPHYPSPTGPASVYDSDNDVRAHEAEHPHEPTLRPLVDYESSVVHHPEVVTGVDSTALGHGLLGNGVLGHDTELPLQYLPQGLEPEPADVHFHHHNHQPPTAPVSYYERPIRLHGHHDDDLVNVLAEPHEHHHLHQHHAPSWPSRPSRPRRPPSTSYGTPEWHPSGPTGPSGPYGPAETLAFHGDHVGIDGDVHTYVKTTPDGMVQWSVRHRVG